VSEAFPVFDVLVAGGGNAALCAALSAAEQGAKVILLESAPREFRGGNSRHTRNLRCAHDGPTRFLTDWYTEEEYFDDLVRVTGGEMNEELASLAIRESHTCTDWMHNHGVRFQPALPGTLHLARTNLFFLGGGKALLNSYYNRAEQQGVRIVYSAEVVGLGISDGAFESATVQVQGEPVQIRAKAFVAATGGFESNLDWLRTVWGQAADNFLIRGTPYNRGKVLKLLFDNCAEPVGNATQCHAVAIDARAPKYDGGIVTRIDCIPLGIVVNQKCERFYDEGEDLWPKRYAIWGRLVAAQPDQIAWSIIDSKAIGKFMPTAFPAIYGNTIPELAAKLGLSSDALGHTVERFNTAVQLGTFDHERFDDCRTCGLTPEKSHWARAIDTPPFLAYAVRPGITFTYLGTKVNSKAQVMLRDGRPAHNIFAAGEIMAGNILGRGYLAGIGMLIGTVFGRLAGREGARLAH
jgi:tricarballylate dehydrogenase